MTKTTLTDLTLLILQLNHLVDYGLHEGVTIEEAHQHIEDGDLMDWLRSKFRRHIDLSLLMARPDICSEIIDGLRSILVSHGGDEDQGWGIKHNGICLLIAWVNELVQQRKWVDS